MPTSSTFRYHVFLSHNGAQKDWAREVVRLLEANGLRVFFDEKDIQAGESIPLALQRALPRSRHVVLVLSPEAVRSDWVALEYATALYRDPAGTARRIIPVKRAECETPALLAHLRRLDLVAGSVEEHAGRILDAVDRTIELVDPAEEAAADARLHALPALDLYTRLGIQARGLLRHVQYRPPTARGQELRQFLLTPRVIDIEAEERARAEHEAAAAARDGPYAPRDADTALGSCLDALERPLAGHAVLRGEPGQGKTVALWMRVTDRAIEQHGRELARDSASEPPAVILGLPLRELGPARRQGHSLLEIAREHTLRVAYGDEDSAVKRSAGAWLEAATGARIQAVDPDPGGTARLEIYLDALDEVPDGPTGRAWLRDQLATVLSDLPGARVFVTTRFGGREDDLRLPGKPRALRMTGFDIEDVRYFVERYLELAGRPALVEELLQHIHRYPGPREVARVPLLLALLCEAKLAAPSRKLPERRTPLVRRAVEALIRRADERRLADPDDARVTTETDVEERAHDRTPRKLEVLSQLAWRSHAQAPRELDGESLRAVLNDFIGRFPKISSVIELARELREDGVLVAVDTEADRFAVRTLHELFFASEVARRLATLRGRRLRAALANGSRLLGLGARFDPLREPEWENVWPFVLGRLEGEPATQRIVLQRLLASWGEGSVERIRWFARPLAHLVAWLRSRRRADTLLEPEDRPASWYATLAAECDATGCRREREAVLARIRGIQDIEERLGALLALGTQAALDDVVRTLDELKEEDELCLDAVAGFAAPQVVASLLAMACDNARHYRLRERGLTALRGVADGASKERLRGLAIPETPPWVFLRQARDGVVDRAAGDEPLDSNALDRNAASVVANLVGSGEYRRLEPAERHNRVGFDELEHVATGMVFVHVPAQEFLMGSPPGEGGRSSDEHLHRVRVSPYLIARTTISQAMWRRGLEAARRDGGSESARVIEELLRIPGEGASDLPMVEVSWDQSREFAALFGWTLPTEAQWECAARAGSPTAYPWGNAPEDPTGEARMRYSSGSPESAGETAAPVTSYPPNDFGLYQMHGNVWEWCHDVFDPDFYRRPEAEALDPVSLRGSWVRVRRGGGWVLPCRALPLGLPRRELAGEPPRRRRFPSREAVTVGSLTVSASTLLRQELRTPPGRGFHQIFSGQSRKLGTREGMGKGRQPLQSRPARNPEGTPCRTISSISASRPRRGPSTRRRSPSSRAARPSSRPASTSTSAPGSRISSSPS